MAESSQSRLPRPAGLAHALSLGPGWLVLGGAALSTFLYDDTPWSAAPFVLGALAATVLWRQGYRLGKAGPRPEEKGRLKWLSEAAHEMYVSGPYLNRLAASIDSPPRLVRAAAWIPWLIILGLWVLLVVYAVIDIATGP